MLKHSHPNIFEYSLLGYPILPCCYGVLNKSHGFVFLDVGSNSIYLFISGVEYWVQSEVTIIM